MDKSIKNLLFDLGGVISDISRDNCVNALKRLGMKDADEMIGLYVQTGPFQQLESGALSADEFRTIMRQHFSVEVSDKQINDAFCAFIIGIPVSRLKALRQLRKQYRTYLLSNTNPIIFEGAIAENFKQEGLDVNAYFDGMTVSYKARCNKPDAAIFHYAERTLGIKPEETLFFDDSQTNLDAAERLGYKTQLIEPGTEFIDYVK